MEKIYAAIDVGTNSVRMLAAKVQGNKLLPLLSKMQTTRIGQGVGTAQKLQPEPIARTLATLREYAAALQAIGVDGLRIVTTSAVREALNATEFIGRAAGLGLSVEIISAEVEAQLSFAGVARGLAEVADPTVLDIGGGSTEFIWQEPNQIKVYSVPLGAVKLAENPLAINELPGLYANVLLELLNRKEAVLVGVGGTITTLAAIKQQLAVYQPDRVHGFILERTMVKNLHKFLSALSLAERRAVVGLQPERADIILAGTALLWEIMVRTDQDKLVVSTSDLLQGIIWDLADGRQLSDGVR